MLSIRTQKICRPLFRTINKTLELSATEVSASSKYLIIIYLISFYYVTFEIIVTNTIKCIGNY